MIKKVCSLIIVLVLIACSYSFIVIKAATLEEQKQEIQTKKGETEARLEYVKEELTASILKIQELDDTIKNAEAEIDSLAFELENLQNAIDEKTKKLDNLEDNYKANQQLLEQRLVVMYELGEVTYLEVLFNSASIMDFLSNYYTIEEIVQSDADLLNKIQEEKNEVEKSKQELDQQKAEIKVKKAKQEQLYVITQNNKILRQQEIESLSIEEQELQRKIEEYKNEEARIEALIQIAANQYVYSGDYTGGIMAWPVAKSGTYITSGFGIRRHPIQGIVKGHSGIDIGNAGLGAPVIAAEDGIVTMAGRYGGYGNCVMISHGSGISTLYGHGQTILTEVGKEVKKGDLIMEVGSTGVSTGPHLHFEVRVNGSCVNPMPYLNGEIVNSQNNNNNNNQ